MLHGDARQLTTLLPPDLVGHAALVVTSPPYGPSTHGRVSVIPGGQGLAEMESNLEAASATIPPGLWDRLKREGLLRPDAPTGG